jgi:hypothetical protein
MPPLDARAIVAELMRRQFSAPPHTITAHGRTTVRTIQANVALSSSLTRSHGLPARLTDVARVGGKALAAENVVFDYTPQPAIALPK